MKVFISSVRRGLEEERDSAPPLIAAVGHLPRRFEDFTAQPRPSRDACLAGVEDADVYLLLLGPNYGDPLPDTGLAPTEEEWTAAKRRGVPIVVFRKADVEMEDAQAGGGAGRVLPIHRWSSAAATTGGCQVSLADQALDAAERSRVRAVLNEWGVDEAEDDRLLDECLLPFLEPHEPGPAGYQALLQSKQPGQDATLVSYKPRNLGFRWKSMVLGVAAAVTGAAIAPVTALGLISAGLATIVVLAAGARQELNPQHAEVVLALYQRFGDDDVLVLSLREALPEIPADRLDEVLDDLADLGTIRRIGPDRVVKRERLLFVDE